MKKTQSKIKVPERLDPLHIRINEYFNIKGIADVIIKCSDLPMRRYMFEVSGNEWQSKIAEDDYKYLKAIMKKKGHVDSIVYKVIELGELLKCKELYGECEYAKNCWVTRRGLCCDKRRASK